MPPGFAVFDRELPSALWKGLEIIICSALGVLFKPEQGSCPAESPGVLCVADMRVQRCISYQSLKLMNLRKISRGCKCR